MLALREIEYLELFKITRMNFNKAYISQWEFSENLKRL